MAPLFGLRCPRKFILAPWNWRCQKIPAEKVRGALAQLVERLVRNEKVSGSNPLCSTPSRGNEEFLEFSKKGVAGSVGLG